MLNFWPRRRPVTDSVCAVLKRPPPPKPKDATAEAKKDADNDNKPPEMQEEGKVENEEKPKEAAELD
ncbi:hypothetical protein ERJ75_000016900 [Trypanosoma vivax]|nr:hypothetical protein ERJ75_000016900 [Trypanosoma vivax]